MVAAGAGPCSDGGMDHERSNETVDKLQAALNHDFAGSDQDLPPSYVGACRTWYAGLSGAGKRTAELARIAMAAGREGEAERYAAELPAAPRFPL